MKWIYTFVLFALITNNTFADEPDSDNKLIYSIKPCITAMGADVQIMSPVNGKSLHYAPNCSGLIGVGLSYKGYGLTISQIDKGDYKKEKQGDTDGWIFQFYNYYDKWIFDYYCYKFSGLYLYNPGENNIDADDRASKIRSDMKMFSCGLNAGYSLNDEISLGDAYRNNGKPKTSGGGFIILAGIKYFKLSADRNLIPESAHDYYGYYADLQGVKFLVVSCGIGYNRIFNPIWKIYLTPGVAFSTGLSIVSEEYPGHKRIRKTAAFKQNYKVALKYDDGKYYMGLAAFSERCQSAISNGVIASSISYVELFAGIRF